MKLRSVLAVGLAATVMMGAGGHGKKPKPTPEPTPTVGPTPQYEEEGHMNVWISPAELAALPMSGPAWDSIAKVTISTTASVANQDSNHDLQTLGAALKAARTGVAADRDKAVAALTSAIGTEAGARWLAVGRNLGAYIIAADLLGIRSGPVYDWLASFNTKRLSHNNEPANMVTLRQVAWSSGSNADAQEGFVHGALNSYLGNRVELDWGWNAFKRYLGDRTTTHTPFTSNDDSWQELPAYPVGIQNRGAVRGTVNLDGAISNDMSRGGTASNTPKLTTYPWVGLEGAVPAAVVYWRQGYDSFEWMDHALLRAATYLYNLRTQDAQWYDVTRAREIKRLLNWAYGLTYPEAPSAGSGRTVSYTEWTHPGVRPLDPEPQPEPEPMTLEEQVADHERRISALEAR